jgi:hypothetical protein
LGAGSFRRRDRRTERCPHLHSSAEPAAEIPNQHDATGIDRFVRDLDDLVGLETLVGKGLHEFEERRP